MSFDSNMTSSDWPTPEMTALPMSPTIAMLSTENIGTLYIWFGFVEDLARNDS